MKKFIIPIVIVLILAFFYVYYSQTKDQGQTGALLSQNKAGNSAASVAVGAEIISLLNKLEAINLDTALFREATFQSLKDFSITLRPQEVGRANPFAPIGNDGASGASGAVAPRASSLNQSSFAPATQNASGSSIQPPASSQNNNSSSSNTNTIPEEGTTDFADGEFVPIETE